MEMYPSYTTVAWGCGVTAYTVEDALLLLNECLLRDDPLPSLLATTEDVDVSTLDPDHVLPNIAPPNERGIWFPNTFASRGDLYVDCPVCEQPTLSQKPYERWPPPRQMEIAPPYEDFLGRPSYEVCARCGFEFGNDDNPGTGPPKSFSEYRREWQARGSLVFDDD